MGAWRSKPHSAKVLEDLAMGDLGRIRASKEREREGARRSEGEKERRSESLSAGESERESERETQPPHCFEQM